MIDYNPLAYTSPETKTRVEYVYNGNIQDDVAHNLGEFTFSGRDGKHYQDRSLNTGSYTFGLILKDQASLEETRNLFLEKSTPGEVGILEHPDPTLGSFPAVVSSFSVVHNSIKQQGIVRVEVTFFKTIPDLLAGDSFSQENPASAQSTLSKIEDLNESQANDLANSIDLSTGAGVAAFIQSTIDIVTSVKETLDSIASEIDAVSIAFTDAYLDILNNVEEYINTPYELARKIQNFIQLPMLATDSVRNRVAGYEELLEQNETFSIETIAEITSGSPTGKTILSNRALTSLAILSAINYTAVSGQSVSIDKVLSGETFEDTGYISREQIVDMINLIQLTAYETTDTYSTLAVNFGSDIFFGQYFDYSILNRSITTASIRNLNNRIFSSRVEQRSETIEEMTPIQVCAELYKSVELSTIQFMLDSNSLHGDSIFLIPKGTEITHY